MSKKKELPQVQPVHLKPHFGMQPGKWLLCAYALGLALAIFLVAVLPDLIYGSKRVTYTSKVPSAVYVDGNYAGGTPFTTKTPSGSHTAVFLVEGVVIDEVSFKVSKPVFLAWLFPRHQKVSSSVTLSKDVFEKASRTFLTDAAMYSAITNYDDVFRYRPIFADYAKTVEGSDYVQQALAFMDTACGFISTEEMACDAQDAYKTLNSSMPNLESAMIYEVKSTLSKTTLDAIDFKIEGLSNGQYSIASSRVTETMWAYFVKENPTWAASNRANLLESSLVDEYYLDGTLLSSYYKTEKSITGISYESALAFCEWLGAKTGKNVFIPSQEQWLSAKASGMQSDSTWEFTSNACMPYWTPQRQAVLEEMDIPFEIVVLNQGSTPGAAARNLCGDYTGLRLAWTD